MPQKRSPALAIDLHPIALDPLEPVWAHADHELSDRPITFLHVHQCLEIGCCHSGHGVFMIGDKVRTFSTGDVVFITSAEPHFARSAPGTSSRWTWIYLNPVHLIPPGAAHPHWLDTSALRGARFPNVFPAAAHPALARASFRLAEELAGDALGKSVAIRALVLEILVQAHRLRPQIAQDPNTQGAPGGQSGSPAPSAQSLTSAPSIPPTKAPRRKGARTTPSAAPTAPDYQRLAPALQTLARDYAQPLKIAHLARKCSLSEPQFRRVFRQTMGCSPLAYLNDLRVRTAAALLRGTTKTVLEISLQSGFESVSSLHRAFRDRMGTTPREWRQGIGGNG